VRLLVASNTFEPDHAGGASIYTDFAREMAARGHEVTVRCTFPYFPEWQDKSGQNGLRVRRQIIDGMHVERFGVVLPKDPRALTGRLLFEGSHLLSLARSIPRDRFDVILAFATNPSTTAFAVLVSRLRRLPLWISVQDLASGAAEATGVAGGARTRDVLTRLDRAMLRRASVISCISPGMVSRVETLVPGADVRYVPNWLHQSAAAHVAATSKVERRGVEHGRLRLLYAGNVGGKQDLLALCKALAASDVPFHLRMQASGSEEEALHAWFHETGDDRFSLGPILPEGEFVLALRDCDLFVISERPGSEHSYMPSKLLPALAAGTPVLAVCDRASSLAQELETSGAGLVVGWDEVHDLGSRLAGLGASDLAGLAARAAARSATFDRERIIDELAGGLEHLAMVGRRAVRPGASGPD
jgi:colanic acid biosynthesis glycosyl transferase WcaI